LISIWIAMVIVIVLLCGREDLHLRDGTVLV
jgi:hypothetical protein